MDTRKRLSRIGIGLAIAIMLAGLSVPALVSAAVPAVISPPVGDVVLELMGQVTNSSPTASIQFGYLPYIQGVDPLFSGMPADEKSALFSFYTEATTTQVINNGPFRIIIREGTTTIYYSSTPSGDFATPDSFRGGMPVQVSTMRQQVIVDTVEQSFTVVNVNTITNNAVLTLGTTDFQLGTVGQKYRTSLMGRLTDKGPPSGYFAGSAVTIPQAM